uniref:Complement component 1 Q subcomponent-binding protein, mitochondrial n=1 Tax=Leptobrachium leishanense TaxID=445787 RepID=A0A8C5PRT1_9ANUR
MLSSLSRALIATARVASSRPTSVLSSLSTVRSFTRSLWVPGGSALRPTFLNPYRGFPAVSCGCGGLHTEGDKAFADFLSDEIKEEKKIQKHKTLPKMTGNWELELNGTEAKLLKKLSGEKITVTFNTNNSIPPSFEESQEGQKADENEPELVSTPNFVVEVTKQDTNRTLVLDCHYPEDEVGRGEEEEESDLFTIREVSFQPTGETDWKENSYTLSTDSLDWALYDHLMDFLADRGVDNTFADELVELSTALEHQEYILFLENLKGFVKC